MACANSATVCIDTQPLPSEKEDHQELLAGLNADQKTINPKYFYDQKGSELFEKIMALPEYYPTRTEINILKNNADSIAELAGDNIVLIEPGAGNCEKVRHLLNEVRPDCYLPMDISGDFLQGAVKELVSEFPWLSVRPIAADFNQTIELPPIPADNRVVVFYPGSTIGNFNPTDAVKFLMRVKQWIQPNGGLLLGVDLQKDPDILHAAYNDAQGVTEQFNLNVLNNVNSVLDSDFASENFAHHAFYNTDDHRIEMHLVATNDHEVKVGENEIQFKEGETIHTENSYKYTLEGISDLAKTAGMRLQQSWYDDDALFSMNYLVAE